ncbi:hypothetical protein Gogos_021774 [Gossypium gossypioides]|uniref:Uncharacterized protein n=1 Tax=Gossypium gossypioides TaxID=34282 RepID=A0A7J9D421_GOSGO|nr:hypothetical protein [Gossypium gossypioides]
MSLCRFRSLQKYLCQINRIIPAEIWPSEDILAPWDEDKPLTPYQEHQANQATFAWKDIHEDISSWKDIHELTPPDDLEKRIKQLELKCYEAREEKKRKIEELNITSDISTDYDTD